jgi:2-succinyl-5-enolpyruvyl-6-hydroxy-3-cyclohexene-1-carboxylate synthase
MSGRPGPHADPVYDVIAAFAAGLVEHGVRDVVISPGSRSTPLAVTLHAQPELQTWIRVDERSAGFFALGQAKATGRPSVLVCTSGTAAANYLPAVVEAHHSGVPMIVCTADRPPELRGWGAGQTIEQVGLYGAATRWAVDLPVAGAAAWTPDQARIVAHRAVDTATAVDAGPVHLNWPLREPLEPVGAVPVVAAHAGSGDVVAGDAVSTDVDLAAIDPAARGVIVVGPDVAANPAVRRRILDAALSAGARAGWPVIGEPVSGIRRVDDDHGAGRVAHADHLLRVDEIAAELRPDLVIRLGASPTTKPVRQWLERHGAPLVLLDPARRWNDASFTVRHHLTGDPEPVLAHLARRGASVSDPSWQSRWLELDRAAASAVEDAVGATPINDAPPLSATVARTLGDAVAPGTLVMTSNSMPVRDLDAFVGLDGPVVDFVGNRGASGIDGITSTALGLASRHRGPVVLFTGDLALIHDLGALVGAARLGVHLTIVCVDNDGGGIFSMLPIAGRADEVDFETLFRTPHGLDLAAIDGIGGVRARELTTAAALAEALATATRSTGAAGGIDLLVVPVDRDDDVAHRRSIAAAVRDAVT